MSNVLKMPEPEKALDQAGDWIVKFDRGLTIDEKTAFKRWVCSSQQNHNAFMSMAQLWDGMDELSRLSDLFPEEEVVRSTWGVRGLSAAASTIIALVVTGIMLMQTVFTVQVAKRFETSVGEHSTVNLPDGTQIVLNTNSLVTVNYDSEHRLVTLERGEIHIDVAHDESRPLSVRAGEKVVQAVGTAFNLELYDDNSLELIVTAGKVRVADRASFDSHLETKVDRGEGVNRVSQFRLSEKSLAVAKGEKIVLGSPRLATGLTPELASPIKIAERDIQASLSWRGGNLVFNGQSLEEAILEISRYTSVEFEFRDEDIKAVRIAGRFKAGDVNGLLGALNETFGISSIRIEQEKVSLYREIQQ